MATYKINEHVDVEELILTSIPNEMLLKSKEENGVYQFFHNGDVLEIDSSKRTITTDFISEGQMTGSLLKMRLHQWFGKGKIQVIQ